MEATSIDGGSSGAPGGSGSSSGAGLDATVAPIDDAGTDAPPPCAVPMAPDPVPGPGQCVLWPSERICDGICKCDDGCNECFCLDGGSGWGQTDVACPGPPLPPTECTTGAVTPSCEDLSAPMSETGCAALYYCRASVRAACGANACPAVGCVLSEADAVGGTYWCCP